MFFLYHRYQTRGAVTERPTKRGWKKYAIFTGVRGSASMCEYLLMTCDYKGIQSDK